MSDNNIFKINTQPSRGWDDIYKKFNNVSGVKDMIKDIYTKYDYRYYSRLLTPDKITINNLEELLNNDGDSGNGVVIYICSFTFTDGDTEHTSILLFTEKYYFIIHNYETTASGIKAKRKLFVYDNNDKRIKPDSDPTINDPLYFFIKDDGHLDFRYLDKELYKPNSVIKHAKLIKNAMLEIFDYNAPLPGKFVRGLSPCPMLINSYINDKYIGNMTSTENNLSLYKPGLTTDDNIYINITKATNNFLYEVKKNDNLEFSLSYTENDGKPVISITINTDKYIFETSRIIYSNNSIEDSTKYQVYSISKKYIPLFNNSTYISALITFVLKVKELKDDKTSGGPDSITKRIKSRNTIKEFKLSDIEHLCKNVISDNKIGITDCSRELHIMEILINLFDINRDLFDFNMDKNVVINVNGKTHNVYEKPQGGSFTKLSNTSKTTYFSIPIMEDTREVNINSLLTNFDFKSYTPNEGSSYHYYYNNDPTKKLELIKDTDRIITSYKITDIKNYFAVMLQVFDRNGKIKNTKVKLVNMFDTLSFKNKILIPTFMIYYIGNDLNDGGYYITIQHYNNNWYVYDHKNRNVSNFVDEYYFDEEKSHPVFVLYKSYDGTKDTIYKKLMTKVLKDDFDSNDDTINYYLNPQYELTKYKERYIFNNYSLEKAVNTIKDSEHNYVFNENEKLPAREFFYGLNNDLNETTAINLHTNQFINNYIDNFFNVDTADSGEVVSNLF